MEQLTKQNEEAHDPLAIYLASSSDDKSSAPQKQKSSNENVKGSKSTLDFVNEGIS